MIAKLKQVYEYRLKTDKGLQQFIRETKAFEKNLNLSEVSLNESDRLKKSAELSATTIDKEADATVGNHELSIDDQYLKKGVLMLAELITGNAG